MSNKKKLALIGGDGRQCAAAARFLAAGFDVTALGLPCDKLPREVHPAKHLEEATAEAFAVILPLPVSPDGVCVYKPLDKEGAPIRLDALFSLLSENTFVAGGRFPPSVKTLAEREGRRLFDYFTSEELQQKNALPTAEGAVLIAMQELPVVISGLPVAVVGFGRVARALCALLHAMHAKVTVAARKDADLAVARSLGYGTLSLADAPGVSGLCRGQRVIFNTVPHWLFSAEVLSELEKSTLLIDLASPPGGVDASAAEREGIRVIWALSLPGKYAPDSAGQYVADTVLTRLMQEGRA